MPAHPQRAAQQIGGQLGRQLVDQMGAITRDRIQAIALANAARNLVAIRSGHSLRELRKQPLGSGDTAIILAAGPSLKRQQVR